MDGVGGERAWVIRWALMNGWVEGAGRATGAAMIASVAMMGAPAASSEWRFVKAATGDGGGSSSEHLERVALRQGGYW